MPIDFSIDAARGIVHITCSGVVTYDNLISFTARLRAHRDFAPHLPCLCDTTDISHIEITYAMLADYRRALDPFAKDARIAVIAPNTVSFGMARMYQALRESPQFAVFRSAAEAHAWIDGPHASAAKVG